MPVTTPALPASGLELLGSYEDAVGRIREVIGAPRADGCVLVIDRDAVTLCDRRLVAHIAADEPAGNAALVCALYLDDHTRGLCRRVGSEDLADTPTIPREGTEGSQPAAGELVACDPDGGEDWICSVGPVRADRPLAELRWQVRPRSLPATASRPVSLREVVAAIESYEPVYELSLTALSLHEGDPEVSGAALRCELERQRQSPVILNRALREAVHTAIERGLSMGEIALRCNRFKRDGNGNHSGETSWLARRIGTRPESGCPRRTPWIHSEVLALIAREGLGISPREVEL